MKTLSLSTNYSHRSLGWSALLVIPLLLACFALSPQARAVCQEGCLSFANTVLGEDALFNNKGSDNTAIGFNALSANTTGGFNTATGFRALNLNTSGFNNTATGLDALQGNTTGSDNTADGVAALVTNRSGNDNTAVGSGALISNFNGDDNTAIGRWSLFYTTGNNNIALGAKAGMNLTTGCNNINIGNSGVAAEANTIRIGSQGTQTATFIAGVSGAGVMGTAVKVNAAGQIGTAPSSARFKDQIKPMDKASEAILGLKPVTFRYKPELDPEGIPQFGLVAEEVEKVNPDLVARDAEGKPYSVRYEAVNAMLLNEFLKEHRKVAEQDRKIQEQEATITQLKKEMKTVVARLEEQAAQIQKVSAHLELNKTASQIVLNNQ